jgi:hypothetical protein
MVLGVAWGRRLTRDGIMPKRDQFWEEVLYVSDQWERMGWLHKFRDQQGQVIWELTPIGRRELGLPPLLSQRQ